MQQILPPGRKALSSFICTSCRRRQFSATATPTRRREPIPAPPPAGYAQLSSRRLISVAGPDAAKFLHGLVTRSVVAEPGNGRRLNTPQIDAAAAAEAAAPGFYAAFLNARGRVLNDVFVYRDTLGLGGGTAVEGEAFVIEVDAGQAEALAAHMKRYKLRRMVSCRVLHEEECSVWQVWDGASASLPALEGMKDGITLPDTRAPGMGSRVLRLGDGAGYLDLNLEKYDDTAYRIHRYLLGVAEGQAEIPREQALPQEANMDAAGGIDFRKGCYVGQELTIRTRHRGVVRKRILPCLLYPSSSASASSPSPRKLEYNPWVNGMEEGNEISAENVPSNLAISRKGRTKGTSAGTWLGGVGNVGLALCRLHIMTGVELLGETRAKPFNPDEDEFVLKWGAEEEEEGDRQSVKIKAFVPDWLREKLSEEWNSDSGH
ncbi:Aminomethyltransferase folate-binding domain-containing protein [Annulohypoxylon maeteangense]|uniref:Aminomethyltransferase folate-binding domain-containing protein n=1 Tax=Annulohypoxylon maeteangense TaxID=1927788 RepID=UPI002007C6BF|nr:Aminomethyltransferase folate-binding domain-containing protein [Annulohypoxylon maeteangense]KAI0881851.1 Aminomethyltransferase folate-binding domain-containing protein [Annulohypoxylon maeteangense]